MIVGLAVLAAQFFISGAPASAAGELYKQLKEIPIGGEGGWDYLAVDSVAHRLYVSHATRVIVVDIESDKIVGEISPTPGVHGIALAPALGRGFVSNGKQANVSIVDLNTLKIVSTVATGENPDAILYEPAHQEVYAFNGRNKSATVINAKTGAVVATIALPGKPEFAVLDTKTGRIFNNIEDTSQLVVIDPAKHAIIAIWPIAPGEEASGLAIDSEHQRLFVGCSNKLMLMMDAVSGKVLATVPIGAGVDADAFDPATNLSFASNSDGTLTVAKTEGQDKLSVVQVLATPPRSRTMTIDPTTHRLYVASAEFVKAEPGPDGKPQRPQVLAGSLKIIVYEMSANR